MKKFYLRDYNEQTDLSDYEMTPRQAIMAFCKMCCGWVMHEALLCQCKHCPLHSLFCRYTKNSRTRKKAQYKADNQ